MFIREVDPALHKEYCLASFREKPKVPEESLMDTLKRWSEFRQSIQLESSGFIKIEPKRLLLPNINELDSEHPAKKYVWNRKIPCEKWNRIYYSPRFMEWTNTFIPGKFSEDALAFDDGRLIFPFYTKEGIFHAYQGRTLNPKSNAKYITIVLDESVPTIYGLDTVDWDTPVCVTEGPIDAMFLPNAIAATGGDMVSKLNFLPIAVKGLMILIFDNETRSTHLKKKMIKAIDAGYKVLIWHSFLMENDINKMVISGHNIIDIVRSCLTPGGESDFDKMKALVHLNAWSKA
jgi:hypothetical protein